MAPYLSVVIPAYNEARRLPQTLPVVLQFLNAQPWSWELLVVDDGSSDQTVAVAEAACSAYAQARVIQNPHRGKGYTVRTGMTQASGEYVLFSDADLAVPMNEWPKLEAKLQQQYDIVIASREGAGASRIDEPFMRHLMGRVFNLIVRVLGIGKFQDTQCGFKVFSREASHDVFGRMRLYDDTTEAPKGAAVTAFDVEVLYLALRRGYKIAEVPVTWRYGEETKVDNIRDSWRNLRDVIKVRWNALSGQYRDVKNKNIEHIF
ncbi:dolichyl-phosphate beta-glucosyltransferase [Herpetosiphon sp. NSE202]|uniref:dolichyl-phosphate beta-glucosyltransferase n=1 Tax=Herpetosiphon sp. NSE202 TaxID=3351349 RepID=UPI0036422F6A